MCGIALVLGIAMGADDQRRFDAIVAGIEPRGESLEEERGPDGLLATSRLKIVDRERAVQPWRDATGRWSLCYNGEVFNHAELRRRLGAEGRALRSESDTEVVLESWLAWGDSALLAFRGEFAFCVVDHESQTAFLARDPAGVKPLYYACGPGRLYVASEVKALCGLGLPITEVPPGHCGTSRGGAPPTLAPYVDLSRLGAGEPMLTDPTEAVTAVREACLHLHRPPGRYGSAGRASSSRAGSTHRSWRRRWPGSTPTALPSRWARRAARTSSTPDD